MVSVRNWGCGSSATVTAAADHLAIAGRISSTSTNDRAILLAFALPIEPPAGDGMMTCAAFRVIEGREEYNNARR
jgi:hypothetical protein